MMRSSPQSRHGFTLVELLVGSALAAIVMSAVLSSYVYLGRNLTKLANYQTLESKGREALTYLRRDFALAQNVKTGTSPTQSTVTLVLPGGEVTYTYASNKLTRTANFGANPSVTLLKNDFCTCPTFAFQYYTTNGDAPLDQNTATAYVPYSIKQIQVSFTVQTPSVHSVSTRATYEAVSSRFLLRNKQLPN